MPYDDGWAITAQILTIVAFILSWMWWPTFLISIVGMVLFQILWCCRHSKSMIYASVVVAEVCSLAQLGVGIFALVVWHEKTECYPFVMITNDYSGYDYCDEDIWASVAFICATLWAASASCMLFFACSGHHARWEEKYVNKADGDENSAPATLELVGATPEAEGGRRTHGRDGGSGVRNQKGRAGCLMDSFETYDGIYDLSCEILVTPRIYYM
jgi:hypothetical protein